ncbi:S-adenosyl-L-methionine-dependent methyltransferase [Vararia minispora EC-137]|uniref:S-adenosyl-L-methionine-dependent methyltransferase n=1 Tax=Vararia minispora EC-137 TaxID=1314806 RepID=A0ACB8QMR6_9AGAM|nr:S-adenosyl-L-methionine-dependent methyltransferase [Vararia minispora EC-137]
MAATPGPASGSVPTAAELHAATVTSYSTAPAAEDGRLKAHRIEFEVTLRHVLRRLPADRPAKVLDIGGGTGPYSFALADRGHDVTLVDNAPGLLDIARARSTGTRFSNPAGRGPSAFLSHILCGDAVCLDDVISASERGSFDAVLLLGPIYHIMDPTLRHDAVAAAWQMVRRGGVLAVAFISRWAHYRDLAMREPARLAAKKAFYDKHYRDGSYIKRDGSERVLSASHHEHPADMRIVLERATGVPASEVHMIGTEGVLAGGLDKLINDLHNDEFEAWVRLCMDASEDEYAWMSSDHIVGFVHRPLL